MLLKLFNNRSQTAAFTPQAPKWPATARGYGVWPRSPGLTGPSHLPSPGLTGPSHLLHRLAQDVLILVLGHLPLLVEGLDGQLHLLHGPLLHMQLLHVLGARTPVRARRWATGPRLPLEEEQGVSPPHSWPSLGLAWGEPSSPQSCWQQRWCKRGQRALRLQSGWWTLGPGSGPPRSPGGAGSPGGGTGPRAG